MLIASKTRSVEEAFNFPTGSFAKIIKERGETFAEALLAMAITELVDDLNLQNTMNDTQIMKAATLLLGEFKLLNPADVSLCFDNMRLGKYGEYYNRMDVAVLSRTLNQYFSDRLDLAESISDRQHQERKKDLVLAQNNLSREKFYAKANDLFDKIKANHSASKENDDRFAAFKAKYIAGRVPLEEQIRIKEMELKKLREMNSSKGDAK